MLQDVIISHNPPYQTFWMDVLAFRSVKCIPSSPLVAPSALFASGRTAGVQITENLWPIHSPFDVSIVLISPSYNTAPFNCTRTSLHRHITKCISYRLENVFKRAHFPRRCPHFLVFLVPITRGANFHHQLLFFTSLTYTANFLELCVVDVYWQVKYFRWLC